MLDRTIKSAINDAWAWSLLVVLILVFGWAITGIVETIISKLGRQEICAQISETLEAYDDCVNTRIEERER